MKSVSIVEKAISINEETKLFKFLTNKQYTKEITEFKEMYVEPFLKEKNITDINITEIFEKYNTINQYTLRFIDRWLNGYIRKRLEKSYNYLNHQKITPGILNYNSKKIFEDEEEKKIIAKMICELIYKVYCFDDKCNNFLQTYIVPLLENETTIVFDLNSDDEKIKLITNNTMELFLRYIKELGSMTFRNAIFLGTDKNETEPLFNYFNFLFIDDEEQNKYIANALISTFVNEYKKMDLTKKPRENIKYLYEVDNIDELLN